MILNREYLIFREHMDIMVSWPVPAITFISAFHSALNAYISENNIIAEFTRFHP